MLAALVAVAAACSSGGSSGDTDDIVSRVRFEAGEVLTYDLIGLDGTSRGTGVLRIEAAGDDLVLIQEYEGVAGDAGAPPAADTTRAVVSGQTLRPRSVVRELQLPDEHSLYEGTYDFEPSESSESPVVAFAWVTDGNERERELKLRDHAYENETSLWLWRTLPFTEGYEAAYTSVSIVERSQQTAELLIVRQERITVPAGTFETLRLQIRNGRATRVAWLRIDAPHEVVRWDNGSTVFRLLSIGRADE